MAQLDRLLTHLASRGGKLLRLDPNQQPVLESPDGSLTPVLPNAVPAPLLEHLASEVMVGSAAHDLAQRGETEFDYRMGEGVFRLRISRSGKGTHIQAEVKGDPSPAPKAPEAPRIELAADPTPRSTAMPRNPWEAENETQIIPPPASETTAKSTQPLPPPPVKAPPIVDASQLPDLDLQPVPVIPLTPRVGATPSEAPTDKAAIPHDEQLPPPPSATPIPSQPPVTSPELPVPRPMPAASPSKASIPPAVPSAPEKTPSRIERAAQENGKHPLAEKLFLTLIQKGGSDLHVSAFETPMARIHGDLLPLDGFEVLNSEKILEMMEAIASSTSWQQFQDRMDADFAYPFEAGGCRLRVNYFLDRKGPGLVCRVIPNELPDPDKLGLSDPIKRLADLAKGLVLVTGPTGSGKSTTLAAILDLVNRNRNDHILTIEDPIEFVHPKKKCLVNQREVGTHTESFKSGLRAALREDPDVVLVGEMRDLETIAIALETAITGHLVFGTLHTNSAVGTIDRIVDQFPSDRQQQIRVMLADALKASLSQTLLKKKGGGRIAAIESLFITPAIANLIREGKNFQITSAMQTGRAYGQRLMNDLLVEYIQKNLVDPMEAYMKCPDKESYMASLKRAGINWDPRGDERPMPM